MTLAKRAAPVSAVIGPEGGTLVFARLHVDDLRRWFDTSQTGAGNYQFPRVRPLMFGINPSWREWQQNPPPNYTNDAMLAKIRDGGATCIRSGIDWQAIQPNGPSSAYVWNTYDTRIGLAQKHGIQWVADVGTAPNWATGNTSGQMPPLSQYTADFEQFVTAVAQRYYGQIREYGWDVDSNPTSITPSQQQAYL